jgi:hypothetical protein
MSAVESMQSPPKKDTPDPHPEMCTSQAVPKPTRVPSPEILSSGEFEDPTEQLAFLLGLDPLLLAHHTGLVGKDMRGAVARLKFALAHPVTRASMGYDLAPNHQKLTKSVALKQRPRKVGPEPVIDVPLPPSPHLQQVCSLCIILALLARMCEVPLPPSSLRTLSLGRVRVTILPEPPEADKVSGP